MIARLKGILDSAEDGRLVVDVNGVGYLVFASARTLSALPMPGQAVTLLIETHVREDHIHLYGFARAAEREAFRLLLGVQGVGAKVALSILSILDPDELAQAVAAGDHAAVARTPGVGTKIAQRVVSELKGKMGAGAVLKAAARAGAATDEKNVPADAVSALVNLGYRRSEAFGAVAQAASRLGERADLESLIPAALKELSS